MIPGRYVGLSVFLAHGLILYPPKSLAENIGMDGSVNHSGDADFTQQSLADFRGDIKLPETIEVSHLNKEVTETLRKASKRSFVSKIKVFSSEITKKNLS